MGQQVIVGLLGREDRIRPDSAILQAYKRGGTRYLQGARC